MDSVTITLAGVAYEIAMPLNLGQLIDLGVAVSLPPSADPQDNVRRSYKRSVDVVSAALKPTHPEINATSLLGMAVTPSELVTAAASVLELSGLVSKKELVPGEAPAAAVEGSTGST